MSTYIEQYEATPSGYNWTLLYQVNTGSEESMPEAHDEMWAAIERHKSLMANLNTPRTVAPNTATTLLNQTVNKVTKGLQPIKEEIPIPLTNEQRSALYQLVYNKCSEVVWCTGLELLTKLK